MPTADPSPTQTIRDLAETVTRRVATSARSRARGWGRFRGPFVLLAVALVFALAGGLFLVRAAQLRDTPAAANGALVAEEATTQVIGDVSNALTKIFSYSYQDTEATEQAAEQVLTGNASAQYETLFSQVAANAGDQELVVTTEVLTAGVISLHGDRARLLVFLNQTYQRGDGDPTRAAAQLLITAQHQPDGWRIAAIEPR